MEKSLLKLLYSIKAISKMLIEIFNHNDNSIENLFKEIWKNDSNFRL